MGEDTTTVGTYSLVELEDVKYELDIEGKDVDTDRHLISIIDGISAWFELLTGENFITRTHTDEYQDGDGETYLYLDNEPITSITSIYDDVYREFGSDTLISGTDYYISKEQDRVVLYPKSTWGRFRRGEESVKATYVAGYSRASLPPALHRATIKQVVAEYKMSGDPHIVSKSLEDGSIERFQTELLPYAKSVLARYTKVIVF